MQSKPVVLLPARRKFTGTRMQRHSSNRAFNLKMPENQDLTFHLQDGPQFPSEEIQTEKGEIVDPGSSWQGQDCGPGLPAASIFQPFKPALEEHQIQPGPGGGDDRSVKPGKSRPEVEGADDSQAQLT